MWGLNDIQLHKRPKRCKNQGHNAWCALSFLPFDNLLINRLSDYKAEALSEGLQESDEVWPFLLILPWPCCLLFTQKSGRFHLPLQMQGLLIVSTTGQIFSVTRIVLFRKFYNRSLLQASSTITSFSLQLNYPPLHPTLPKCQVPKCFWQFSMYTSDFFVIYQFNFLLLNNYSLQNKFFFWIINGLLFGTTGKDPRRLALRHLPLLHTWTALCLTRFLDSFFVFSCCPLKQTQSQTCLCEFQRRKGAVQLPALGIQLIQAFVE